jgi:hypothetical protein
MKRLLLILPVLGIAACAGQHPVSTTTAAAYPNDSLPEDTREPSHVHTYLVNDYIDPNNPRLRHRGHAVDVVEQDEKWNLDSAEDQNGGDGNYGPAGHADDPNGAPNPYSAEFETELSQQRDQSSLLAEIGAKMMAQMGRLEEMAEKEADAVSESATLRTRLEDLQREIDELKPQPAPPVNPNAPKKPSWWQSIFDLFRQLPDGTPVAKAKPDLHAALTVQPVPPVTAPEVFTTSPAAPTNAPDEVPSPGEMAQPQDNASTNTP